MVINIMISITTILTFKRTTLFYF